jgi:hypothetical protein
MLFAAFFRQNPGPIGHRWLMTDMLTMAAFQISHPIAKLIHMIANNRLLHAQASLTPSLLIPQQDAEKVRLLRSRLIEILNAPLPGKELFRQLGVGRVEMLRLRVRLACGLAGRPF